MWKYPKIISHRGGGFLAPENTLSAMNIALYYNNYAVEYDVMLTKDNYPIIIHDDILGRTIKGEGNISDLYSYEILQYDAGMWWNNLFKLFENIIENNDNNNIPEKYLKYNIPQLLQVIKQLPKTYYENEKVPSFESVANYCKINNIWMNIEIKPAPGFDQLTGEVVANTTKNIFQNELSSSNPDYTQIPLFSSFSYDSLLSAKLTAPEIPRSYLTETIPSNWQTILTELEASNLHCDHNNLTKELAQEIKSHGYGLACYTVNDTERADELFSWGVDAIFTDRIDLFTSYR